MSASCSAVGSTMTAQSEYRKDFSSNSIKKKLDGVRIPSARPIVIIPASITRALGQAAPATIASASPARTIIPA